MEAFFRRQLAIYADHHRDPRNRAAHYIGIPLLFLAVILPLALWRTELAGVPLTAASVLTPLGVLGWMVIDRSVGAALMIAVAPLVGFADWIASRCSAVTIWGAAACLLAVGSACLAVGHAVFERRRPAFADNLFQTYIGPMFVVAKMLVALGWRPDLADALSAGRNDFNAALEAKLVVSALPARPESQ